MKEDFHCVSLVKDTIKPRKQEDKELTIIKKDIAQKFVLIFNEKNVSAKIIRRNRIEIETRITKIIFTIKKFKIF